MDAPTPATSPDPRSAPLLERSADLAVAAELLRRACDGDGRLLVVEGPAGIGKSSLLAQVRAGVPDGVRVLTARASELERDFPFGVVRQIFEDALRRHPDPAALLAGSAAAARPVLAPLGAAGAPPSDASFAALHGLYWLTVNLAAEAPLVVVVDDLHWCDAASLRFLAYLVPRLDGLPVLVATSLRPAEPGADLAVIGGLTGDPAATVVRPSPLSARATADLIATRLGTVPDETFAAACHRASGGNPLLLAELLSEVRAGGVTPDAAGTAAVRDLGPRAVSRAVAARMARLDPGVRRVAGVAAVLGDGAEVLDVADLAGLDEDATAAALAVLGDVEVVHRALPVSFVHPLVRSAVYFGLAPAERERLHVRAAARLGERGAPPERVAAHLRETRPRGDSAVVESLLRAGDVALARGAGDGAVAYLRRALAEPPSPAQHVRVQTALGLALSYVDGAAATGHLREAYAGTPDPVARGHIATGLVSALLFQDRIRDAVDLAAEAAAALPPAEENLRSWLRALRLGGAFWDVGVVRMDDRELAGLAREPMHDSPGGRMLRGVAAYRELMLGAPASLCARLGREASADGVLVDTDNAGMPFCAGLAAMVHCDDTDAVRVADMALARAHETGSLFHLGGAQLFRGQAMHRRGDLGEAWRMLGGSVATVMAWGSRGVVCISAAHAGDLAADRGDLAAAVRLHGEAMPFAAESVGGTNEAWWLASRMRVLLATGDADGAIAVSHEAEERLRGVVENPAVAPWRSLRARALDRLGRTGEATALVEDELVLAMRFGAPGTVGRTLRVLGSLRREHGLAHLQEAVAVLEDSPARLDHAEALAAFGTALRLSRRPSEARGVLRTALEIASACEAAPLVERVRTELYAAGARPRTDALSGVRSLTASERRVADLAADGASNKDIAQSLYVTPKTVEVHLSSAYRKLGIRSRRELAGALAGP